MSRRFTLGPIDLSTCSLRIVSTGCVAPVRDEHGVGRDQDEPCHVAMVVGPTVTALTERPERQVARLPTVVGAQGDRRPGSAGSPVLRAGSARRADSRRSRSPHACAAPDSHFIYVEWSGSNEARVRDIVTAAVDRLRAWVQVYHATLL